MLRVLALATAVAAGDDPSGVNVARVVSQGEATVWGIYEKATEIRAAQHSQMAKEAAVKAHADAIIADQAQTLSKEALPAILKQREDAEKLADQAEKEYKDVVAVYEQIKPKLYAEAKDKAEAKWAEIKAEANAYWQSILAEWKKKEEPVVDLRAEAARKAAEPYFQAQLDAGAIVDMYNVKAVGLMNGAKELVRVGQKLADQAVKEQRVGNCVMAQRLMIQAHGCVGQALLDQEQAKKIYKLAKIINSGISNYEAAANQAAIHAMATFAGLQTTVNGTAHMSPKIPKDRHKERAVALASMESQLTDLNSVLEEGESTVNKAQDQIPKSTVARLRGA